MHHPSRLIPIQYIKSWPELVVLIINLHHLTIDHRLLQRPGQSGSTDRTALRSCPRDCRDNRSQHLDLSRGDQRVHGPAIRPPYRGPKHPGVWSSRGRRRVGSTHLERAPLLPAHCFHPSLVFSVPICCARCSSYAGRTPNARTRTLLQTHSRTPSSPICPLAPRLPMFMAVSAWRWRTDVGECCSPHQARTVRMYAP